ncbi:hypothetical protein NQ314_006718 [Rhamnusium bicolor]|uniref:FHA domain-containing protein n=1 Tax=Rhamnusium bicolor TaxID=1586634 RepID=A0AAV8YXV8_9CUCU|nr:hypothetical protein NQ314_006718 [Rhamnusium bicolor]
MDQVKWRIKNIETGQILDISKSIFKIGRHADADLTSLNSSLSRNHATLSILIDGSLYIQDNKSSNGTFVNKQKIPATEMKLLKHGDIIAFSCCQKTCVDEASVDTQNPLIFEVLKNVTDITDVTEPNTLVLVKYLCFPKKIKIEQTSLNESVDPYAHIKQELEDLDSCENIQNVDLTSDQEGFESTNELINILESPVNIIQHETLKQESNTRVSPKSKFIKPPIVEPHFYNKVGSELNKNNKLKKGKNISDTKDEVEKNNSSCKRKNIDTSSESKKK